MFGAIETDEEIGFPQSSSQSVNVSKGSGGLLVHVILSLLKYKFLLQSICVQSLMSISTNISMIFKASVSNLYWKKLTLQHISEYNVLSHFLQYSHVIFIL